MNTQISEDVFNYVHSALPNIADPLLRSFATFAAYGVPEVETRYRDVIVDENIVGDQRSDLFLNLVLTDLTKIIGMHGVKLNQDETRSLRELLEIADFFLRIQTLENYSMVEGFISSLADSRAVLVHLIDLYSDLSYIEAIEAIEEVDVRTIESITTLIANVKEAEIFMALPIDRKITSLFFSYIGNSDCLGLALYNDGYNKIIPVSELVELLPYPISEKVALNLKSNIAQSALDVLSFLMICSDTQKSPLSYLSENLDLFVEGEDNMTVVGQIASDLYRDFYAENKAILEEILNGNNQ